MTNHNFLYRPLTTADLPQAQALWETCFDDPVPFVQWYFDTRFPPEQARGIFENGNLQCMVQAVPYRIRLRGQIFPTIYIVGLATHPEAREKGLATLILQNVLEEQYAAGLAFIVLMPAIPPFYARRGWTFCYELSHHTLNPVLSQPQGSFRLISPSDLPVIEDLYQHQFAAVNGTFQRTPKDWADLLFDHEMDGGHSLLYLDTNHNPAGYLLPLPATERVVVRESAFTKPVFARDAFFLLSNNNPDLSLLWQMSPGQIPPYPPAQSINNPVMMVRGVNLTQWLSQLQYPSESNMDLSFSVYDPLLTLNRRAFRWRIRSGHGDLTPIPDNPVYLQVSIAELTSWIMGSSKTLPPEVERVLPPTFNYCNDLF